MQSKQIPYLERLDHLRFFAAALVVLFHFLHTHVGDMRSRNPLVSLVDEGHTGIALFMVISGFILTLIAADRPLHYGGFIKNRLLRIYPLYVFAVFLQLLIGTYLEHRNHGFLQLLGWLMPFRSETLPLSPHFVQLWTIAVEFQFYLLFPFLLVFTRKQGARYLWAWLLLLLIIRAAVWLAGGSVRYLAYETLFGRLDQFIIGMLLARHWLQRGSAEGPNCSPVWLLVSSAIVLGFIQGFSHSIGYTNIDSPGWIIWPPIEAAMWASMVGVYLASRPIRVLVAPLSNVSRWLGQLGTISFSLYVLHNLIIIIVNKHLMPMAAAWGQPQQWVFGAAATFALLLPMAGLTWHLIEKPFLAFRGAYAR